MSGARQRAGGLLGAYQLSLERQIERRGSGLASSDEELWRQAEALLREGGAEETRCLGLDALRVMEEALEAAASGRPGRPRAGLQRLAKAFEVLEQAAVNLHLGPWRAEYKVIKMYSGTFTHFVLPALTAPQIRDLFGLLGYRAASAHGEQLRLASPPAGPASSDELLRLSCAFFAARCECRLLLAALGKRGGDAEWELSVVRERQRGHSLQDALDNASRTLDASQPLMDTLDGDLDLYGDDSMNGAQPAALGDHDAPRSLAWVTPSPAPSLDAKLDADTAAPSSPATARSSSAERQERRRPCGESRAERVEPADGERACGCLADRHAPPARCFTCDALHAATCASLQVCAANSHCLEFNHDAPDDTAGSGAVQSPCNSANVAALASMGLSDEPGCFDPPVPPISYHGCCDPARPDPRLLCRTCGVFHAASCREKEACLSQHDTQALGRCFCGRYCSRRPLVLCRYCGREFCSNCWYRQPVSCRCGKTFDQSTSV